MSTIHSPSRRKLLKAAGTIAGLGVAGKLSHGFAHEKLTEDQPIEAPRTEEGKIVFDPHVHLAIPKTRNEYRRFLKVLTGGVIALTTRHSYAGRLASYQFVMDNLSHARTLEGVEVHEIDRGLFASITYKDRTGFFTAGQEVDSRFHLLTLGLPEMIPHFENPIRAAEEIRKRKGHSIFAHPHVMNGRYFMGLSIPQPVHPRHYKEQKTLYQMVDQAEVCNSFARSIGPGSLDFSDANEKAQKDVDDLRAQGKIEYEGVGGSDAHFLPEQAYNTGNEMDSEGMCLGALLERLKKRRYVKDDDGTYTVRRGNVAWFDAARSVYHDPLRTES